MNVAPEIISIYIVTLYKASCLPRDSFILTLRKSLIHSNTFIFPLTAPSSSVFERAYHLWSTHWEIYEHGWQSVSVLPPPPPTPPSHWPRATLPYLLTLFQVHAALQLCLSECGGWGGGVAPPPPQYICKMSDTTNFVFGITTAFLANGFCHRLISGSGWKFPLVCLSVCRIIDDMQRFLGCLWI